MTKLKKRYEIISSGEDKSIDVIRAIVEMNDVQLIGKLVSTCVHLNAISNSVLVDVCEKYGWNTFSTQIPKMFEMLTKQDAIDLLSQLIGKKRFGKRKEKHCSRCDGKYFEKVRRYKTILLDMVCLSA